MSCQQGENIIVCKDSEGKILKYQSDFDYNDYEEFEPRRTRREKIKDIMVTKKTELGKSMKHRVVELSNSKPADEITKVIKRRVSRRLKNDPKSDEDDNSNSNSNNTDEGEKEKEVSVIKRGKSRNSSSGRSFTLWTVLADELNDSLSKTELGAPEEITPQAQEEQHHDCALVPAKRKSLKDKFKQMAKKKHTRNSDKDQQVDFPDISILKQLESTRRERNDTVNELNSRLAAKDSIIHSMREKEEEYEDTIILLREEVSHCHLQNEQKEKEILDLRQQINQLKFELSFKNNECTEKGSDDARK